MISTYRHNGGEVRGQLHYEELQKRNLCPSVVTALNKSRNIRWAAQCSMHSGDKTRINYWASKPKEERVSYRILA
jgi:hypothetical protein